MKVNTKFVNVSESGKVTLSSDGTAIMGVEGYSLKAYWVNNMIKKDSALVTMRKGGKVTTPMPFPRRESGDKYAAAGWEFMVIARLGEPDSQAQVLRTARMPGAGNAELAG